MDVARLVLERFDLLPAIGLMDVCLWILAFVPSAFQPCTRKNFRCKALCGFVVSHGSELENSAGMRAYPG
jgi:hypothetical protein